MSSPSVRKQSASPIRNLDDKSPRKNPQLQTILEEETYGGRTFGLTSILERENTGLSFENRVLNDKVRNYAEESNRFVLENSRLRQENDVLRERSFASGTGLENERLRREIALKDAENDKVREDIVILKSNYDKSLEHFVLENQSLKKQLLVLEDQKDYENEEIKQRLSAMAEEDMNVVKKTFYGDLNRLMENLDSTKALLAEKELEIKHLTIHGQNLVLEHSAYLEQLVSENNILRNQVLQVELKRDNEVKQAENKRELEKSRTHGIITFCKENNAYMEKEVSKLAEELLEKNISIEQFTKDMLKIRRNLEQTEKRYEERISKLEDESATRVKDVEREMEKLEKYHKEELADLKKKEMQLQEAIATKENDIENLQREISHQKEIIKSRGIEIDSLKLNLSRLHDDHAREINKVMSDSRLKRKSMKNLSEVSSLRDLSADGNSSIIKRPGIQRTNSVNENQEGSNGQLYTVQEEIANSQLIHNEHEDEDEDDLAMKDLVLHYENVIQELKNNKALELNLANDAIHKLNQNLREKQQEVLEILERFSPLMEYKLNSPSMEVERKEKIEKHYKANVDLLSVMLDKYSIAALSRRH